ncbi:MAG: SLBB domain-containing protein [Melioribacteraceae bacterium]|nr:SLBB domain-containing protein [Melioribacteraceae bacterium]
MAVVKKNYILLILFLTASVICGQVKDYELGTSQSGLFNNQGGFYDYSDPLSINIKVAVWGFVRYPGRYVVPEYTTITDLFSLAGGPTDDAHLEDLRLYRTNEDKTQQLFKFSFDDLMWESSLKSIRKDVPDLQASDILVVPGSPRLYFKDWFSITLSIVSTLISLAILILNIVRN